MASAVVVGSVTSCWGGGHAFIFKPKHACRHTVVTVADPNYRGKSQTIIISGNRDVVSLHRFFLSRARPCIYHLTPQFCLGTIGTQIWWKGSRVGHVCHPESNSQMPIHNRMPTKVRRLDAPPYTLSVRAALRRTRWGCRRLIWECPFCRTSWASTNGAQCNEHR